LAKRIVGMSCIKVPITKTDKGGFQVIIDLNLYSEKAITATIYRYTDKYFVYQNTMPSNDKQVCVIFETKEGVLDENIVKQFCNDLIDQQLREITTEKYGHIRDLIVEEAFKPVVKS
jgi:His-Xaa-Ser system protein HxsD